MNKRLKYGFVSMKQTFSRLTIRVNSSGFGLSKTFVSLQQSFSRLGKRASSSALGLSKTLIFLLLCLVGWQSSVVAAVEVPIKAVEVNTSSIGCTDDRSQRQDVKMCDVLAVTGGSSLTPPTTVRVVRDSPSGIAPASHAAAARHYNIQTLSAYSHRRTVSGYIYLIRCLRL